MNARTGETVAADETLSLLPSIFATISDAMLVIDENGIIVKVNAALEKMTGWTNEELTGKTHICEICCGIATCTEDLTCTNCFFKQEKMPSFEMRVKTRDGREYPVAASSAQLPPDSKGKIVLILRDMSAQLKAEKERYQQKLTNYVIQAQEKERKRIARELHDGVGQALYSILVGLNVIGQSNLNEQMKQHVAQIQQMTVKAMEEVKRMALELRPSALDDLGLLPAIRSLMKRVEQMFGLKVDLDVRGNRRRYPAAVETALYRIVQEAMTNTVKYAQTDRLAIVFEDKGSELSVTIVDDGVGFDPEQVEKTGNGLGLFGMRERAQLLGGTVEIRSAPGEGTTVFVKIPLREEEAEHGHSRPDF
jgi:two-component system sensor histidine kinase NreB